MTIVKRILIFILIFGIMFLAIKVDANTTNYIITETVSSMDTLYTHYQYDVGLTSTNNEESSQHVFMLTQKETNDSKIVTWAVSDTKGGLTRQTLAGICKDYEEKHPDYIVIGGINGDQFTLGFGENLWVNGKDPYHVQPYYPFIAQNENWFAITAIPNAGGKFAILHTDGRNNPLEYLTNNHPITGMYLYILNNNDERIAKFIVNKFNETPKANEISVFSSHYDLNGSYPTITVNEENLYVIKNATMCIPNNSIDYISYKGEYAQNAFFGKGEITNINTINELGYGDFAISSKDEELMKYLDIGTKVLVQYEYLGLDDIESAIGFHTIQRENGIDNIIPASDSYNNRKYPRSIIGAKDNGEFALIAIDGLQASKGASGANFEEINAILDYYGIKTAYQMDGGGSVTCVVRNESGNFTTVNSPSDGSARSILNAVLFVEKKKPSGELIIDTNTINGVNFNIEINEYNNIINSKKLIFNNEELEINSNKIYIPNIERGKTYNYVIEFQITNGNNEIETVSIEHEIYIPFLAPSLNSCIKEINDSSLTLTFDIIDIDNVIRKGYVLINGKNYDIISHISIISNYDYNDIIYLKIEYSDGKKNILLTIIHPESPPLILINNSLEIINNEINELKVFK